MYSIGQFSVMLNLNKKTLRYYDDIDLFKPAFVAENNQYRYYDESQITVIKEIIRLKDIGIPLERIKKILNEQTPELMNEIYILRLKEIEVLQKKLTIQKGLVEVHLKQEKVDNTKVDHLIERGFFIEEGYVYSNKINCDYEDVNAEISEFYSNTNGLVLTSGHIFKRSLDDSSNGYCEIFAYTTYNENSEKVRLQVKLMCLKVVCNGIIQRENAYRDLFDYTEKSGDIICEIYEKYRMINGNMHIEIIGSIQ